MQEEGLQAPASDLRAPLKERMVESLAELADLHDDVEIVVEVARAVRLSRD